MSQTLMLELPDEVYKAVKKAAGATGKTPAEWIAADLCQRLPAPDGAATREEQPLREQFTEDHWEIFEKVAARQGRRAEELAAEWIAKYRRPPPRPQLTEEELQAARERFRRHIGAVSLGHPTGADNESIDADLAREYGSTHEEEA